MKTFDPRTVDTKRLSDLKALCYDGEVFKVVPAEVYHGFSQEELFLFCVQNGLYSLPTTELLDTLNTLIMEVSPTRNAIEIGSGNGAVARGLGIPGTDSFMQDNELIRAHYRALGQATVRYGDDVIRMDANEAVSKLMPDCALGCWVTHRYSASDHQRGGNQFGIDEEAILASVKRYIVVGNNIVHAQKPIFDKMTRMIRGDFIFSRSIEGVDQNAIYIWDRP